MSDMSEPSCPKCVARANPIDSWLKTYRPLLLIVAYITLGATLAAGNAHDWMQYFMAGFFLVFSFFKLLDIGGFADAYAMYDLLAKRWKPYGYIYPFIELLLGVSYATGVNLPLTNFITLVVMVFSSLGVIQALRNGQKIRCACLGTVLNLPMTSVTVIEDVGMAIMAAAMLAY